MRISRGHVAGASLGLLLLLAACANLVAGDPSAQDAAQRFLPPSLQHPFGTDELRRDLLARTLVGLRSSLAISVGSVGLGSSIGISAGFLVAYAGGWVEATGMRVVDALLAFPGLLAALAIITILGTGWFNLVVAIACISIPTFARLARAQMLAEKNKDYVGAARSLGAGPLRIVFRHVAPNALPPLLTHVALAMAFAVLIEASLSFLGLGQQPPAPSLGGLINASKTYLRTAWWYAFFPSTALAALLLCFNLLADSINDRLTPFARLRKSPAPEGHAPAARLSRRVAQNMIRKLAGPHA